MSDILIRGTEMPKNTDSITVTIYSDGSTGIWTEQGMVSGGMAIELSPHGDLIERDTAIEQMDYEPFETIDDWRIAQETLIYDVPVFLEATE